ncbi:MAG: hypothetical protein AAF542_19440 [Pseudomonadota bacterium]
MNEVIVVLAFDSEEFRDYFISMKQKLGAHGVDIYVELDRKRDIGSLFESANQILLGIGGAGGGAVIYKIISDYLTRNRHRSLTIKRDGSELTLNAHTLEEERALVEELLPGLAVVDLEDEQE